MIDRELSALLLERLDFYPGVVLLGPRQVGKTTLARCVADRRPQTLVLDLERPSDRAQLAEPELFLAQHRDKLVVLDEVQMLPDLFTHLRPEIDADRRAGRFLLLGSASGALLRQRAESLAGRVGYLELTPLLASEVPADLAALQTLWLRGGFPLAHLAPGDRLAYAWRQDFIQSFLQRDLPQMGVAVAADALHRFWRMLAHLQGQMFNASQLALSLGGASHHTATRYLDLLVDTMLVRRLEPCLPNVGKRLVKSPKVYIRDSGLLHALLNIASLPDLQGHPIVGASWEGFVVEQVAAHLPEGAQMSFYRTAAGAEMDIVVQAGRHSLGIEVKFSSAPTVSRGFWQALEDLRPTRGVIVAPVARRFPFRNGVEVVPVWDLPALLAALA
ncbi:ATP-binding protein [Xenophilus sp.]|uniref:ATP-binding protein n=1 Tax=Xenophilus sp. TaxID=1873499 RepID=UPI0037DC07E7